MKTLRLQLRFLIPLLLTLVAAAYLTVPLLDQLTLRWFSRDLNIRGELVANTLAEPVIDAMSPRNGKRLQTGERQPEPALWLYRFLSKRRAQIVGRVCHKPPRIS